MSSSVLIDAQELAKLQAQGAANLLLVDCRYSLTDPLAGVQAYGQGHIPGAAHADLGTLLSGPVNPRSGRHPLPDPQAFAQGMAALGAHDDTLIIAYDAQDSMFAARLWWLLRWVGHENVRVLDGGLSAWEASGGALSTAPAKAQSGSFSLRPPVARTMEFNEVLANLENREKQLLDARSPDRYRGENETLDPIGGHIPGALNRFFKDNLAPDGRFKPATQLRQEFQQVLGDTPPESVLHQCGSGVSACHNLLAMEFAGLPGSTLYPGSWSEWCRQADAPVARGSAA